ncbi:hypothetical protein ACFL54_04175 [Planctomycetota bacterium]
MGNTFIGKWKTDSRDKITFENFGSVTLEFLDDDRLIYTIHGNETDNKICLTYRIEGDNLITNQPSKPREETTKFRFVSEIELSLFFEGIESKYVKISD